ncbi:9-cis-epoxycarotenoid dioxygenase [Halieaceae bacterium IMCC14734]|uniref:9-cis-epoxycarotenoid dioxygenase n=1 Tax=Candidatus Litorirhabdus singularis TaxID=2518993 RepID=A0ABT3TEN0_9GAMM|nr:carotenoid oxygenase family protein [Candidatus Litorirhabdus singularis]MCX2980640.1 9-cis-epoxycarotenoid dioxygenase [Candidatus Litorirhabdus singularis]
MNTAAQNLPTNPQLEENYKPVYDEITAEEMEVIGTIPNDIAGNFLRIGPNPYYVPDIEKYHIFDGDGMIHGVHIRDGKATYRNRFIDSDGLREERAKGEWIYPGLNMFGEMIAKGEIPPSKNTGNTAMVFHNQQLFALMEGGTPYRVTLPDLETTGEHDFDGTLNHNFTAHPKVDTATNEMITFGYSPMPPFLTYSVVAPTGKAIHTKEITIPKGIMMHDCAITENYTIFPDLPLIFDFEAAMNGEDMIRWDPSNGCRFGVVPRLGDDSNIKWFDIEESFLFHVSNSWEEGDEIVFQACRSNRGGIVSDPDSDVTEQLGQLHEWRLNMATGEVSSKPLDREYHCDFPRINDELMGRKNRYLYAARFRTDAMATFDGEMKYDNETGEIQVHPFGDNCESGEAVFAPRLNAQSEDDGYVICFVYDKVAQESECHIIDAKRFTDEPVARIKIPQRVPHGFHASWVAD